MRFTVDAYPDQQFRGQISQVRLNATVTQNVITYPVIIEVPNPDLKLRPSMTANVTIEVATRARRAARAQLRSALPAGDGGRGAAGRAGRPAGGWHWRSRVPAAARRGGGSGGRRSAGGGSRAAARAAGRRPAGGGGRRQPGQTVYVLNQGEDKKTALRQVRLRTGITDGQLHPGRLGALRHAEPGRPGGHRRRHGQGRAAAAGASTRWGGPGGGAPAAASEGLPWTPMDAPVIEIRDLTKVYRMGEVEVRALKGVNLTVERGEFVAIMGPSGSGKSTLMNILGCLDRPTAGTYRLDGVDVSRLDRDQRAEIRNAKIGFVFQSFNLLARTTRHGERRAAAALCDLGLSARRARPRRSPARSPGSASPAARTTTPRSSPAASSSGWRSPAPWSPTRRSCSPTSPPATSTRAPREEIIGIFQELNDAGKTVVLITHEPDIAAHAKRVVYVRDGLIWRDEKIVQTRAHPGARRRARPSRRSPSPSPSPAEESWEVAAMKVSALRLWNITKVGLMAIARNKMRSLLTMLGIIIGVACVITMVAVGTGASSSIQADDQLAGHQLHHALPRRRDAGRARAPSPASRSSPPRTSTAIKAESPAVAYVSPPVRAPRAGRGRRAQLGDPGLRRRRRLALHPRLERGPGRLLHRRRRPLVGARSPSSAPRWPRTSSRPATRWAPRSASSTSPSRWWACSSARAGT